MITTTAPHPHPVPGTPVPGTPTPAPGTPQGTQGTQGTPQGPVSLVKAVGVEVAPLPRRLPPVGPALPGHRPGLRRNDMVALHSALWILALRGGTQMISGPGACPKYPA